MAISLNPHGTTESLHTPHAVMEAALAHVVKNKAEAAYARNDLFEKRRALIESGRNFSCVGVRCVVPP